MRTTALIAALAAVSCGPALRNSTDFTPRKVREVLYADSCALQPYYDRNPPGLKLVVDQNTSADPRVAWGRATYGLRDQIQSAELRRLLSKLYLRVKLNKSAPPEQIQLDVRYQLRGGRRQLPIGARTTVRGLSSEPLELPYHPCLGAFVFGRHHYLLRRRLVEARP